jgi:hypothetical protein
VCSRDAEAVPAEGLASGADGVEDVGLGAVFGFAGRVAELDHPFAEVAQHRSETAAIHAVFGEQNDKGVTTALLEPDLLPSITKTLPGKWTFEHSVWGDEFVVPLGSKLREFDHQAEAAVGLIRRFASATSSSQMWKEHYGALDKELAGYLKKLDQSGLEKTYAAAVLELRCTMRNLKGNAEAMAFGEDGTCKGSIDYRTKKPTKTIHSEDFAFDAILKDVDASKRAAGREFLLWIIKDFRRSGARPELSAVLHSEAKREGAASFIEALAGFKDVDSAEKLIRGK